METTMEPLADRLLANDVHRRFVAHGFFASVKDGAELDKEQVGTFLGQWWYPLHYFTTFLARCVATLPDVASKSAITTILNQEAGGGKADRAHEVIYVDSMARSGFDPSVVTGSAPFPETEALVAGYEEASKDRWSALGFIFATEVTDLLMVSTIGAAVRQVSGVGDNEWIDIHVQQEPEHVEEAEHALMDGLGAADSARIIQHAERMWELWTAFFDRLSVETGVGAPVGAAAGASGR
ncbi:TenA family transcriptional regulator [Spirillospora sp. CA-255316]